MPLFTIRQSRFVNGCCTGRPQDISLLTGEDQQTCHLLPISYGHTRGHPSEPEPRWSRDGKELFYFSPDGKLMVADVTEGPTFKASVPGTLFQVPVAQIAHNAVASQVFGWDVAPDGKRFLIDTATTSTEPVTVVLNWTAELKKE